MSQVPPCLVLWIVAASRAWKVRLVPSQQSPGLLRAGVPHVALHHEPSVDPPVEPVEPSPSAVFRRASFASSGSTDTGNGLTKAELKAAFCGARPRPRHQPSVLCFAATHLASREISPVFGNDMMTKSTSSCCHPGEHEPRIMAIPGLPRRTHTKQIFDARPLPLDTEVLAQGVGCCTSNGIQRVQDDVR